MGGGLRGGGEEELHAESQRFLLESRLEIGLCPRALVWDEVHQDQVSRLRRKPCQSRRHPPTAMDELLDGSVSQPFSFPCGYMFIVGLLICWEDASRHVMQQ